MESPVAEAKLRVSAACGRGAEQFRGLAPAHHRGSGLGLNDINEFA